PGGQALGHACARTGPAAGQPVVAWAAGLRGQLQYLQSRTCRHPRRAVGYAWPAGLRHLIEARQRTCAAPGCRRAAARCDLNHTIPYDRGGPTCECNGAPLCRKHHRAKHAPGWRLTQDQPGVMTWRLPSGRTRTTTGDAYPR
ncbi:MAG TPA: HNH endonuclease signature motif containing protein, partial [Streptosporangiaceae bacterium]|nr:HNH endonuclease signature motif containing protein [Streptosporangiaceae bacterium]